MIFPTENHPDYVMVWKNAAEPDRSHDNMAHTLCMLGTKGYKQKLRIRHTYWFSTATIVARTRPNVTLYAHCRPCSYN